MTFNGDRIGSLIFDDGRNGLTWSPMAPWWCRTVIITLLPDFQIQLFGSFFLLWRCFWLLITILHRSLSLAWRSIPSPITTFPLLRMRGSEKMAENRPHFWRSVAIAAVHPVYIHIVEKLLSRARSTRWVELSCHWGYLHRLCPPSSHF